MTPFFMVWSPEGQMPRCKHKSIGVAKREAQRLARLYPGKTFVVLKAKYSITQSEFAEEASLINEVVQTSFPDAIVRGAEYPLPKDTGRKVA